MRRKLAGFVHHTKTLASTIAGTPKNKRERSMSSVHPAPPVVLIEEKKTNEEGCCHKKIDGHAHTSSAAKKCQSKDEKKRRTKLYTPSFLEKKQQSRNVPSNPSPRKNRKRRSHADNRGDLHDVLDSDSATLSGLDTDKSVSCHTDKSVSCHTDKSVSCHTDKSVSCQSTSAHNHKIDDNPSLVEAQAANTPNPTLAAHIVDCHPLVNGWFDIETGLVDLCVGSPLPSSPVYSSGAGDESHIVHLSAEGLLDRLQLEKSDGVTQHVQGRLLNNHDSHTYYGAKENLHFLESGGAFYSFTCRTYLTPYERDMMRVMANMTSFEDEQKENFVPGFDVYNIHDIEKYTFVIQKAAYLLPGVHQCDLTPELLSSTEYHKNCQPHGAEIWHHKEPNTFRFTRPIVRHVYYMTIQFRVSRIEGSDLHELSRLMGIRVDHGILMERTKRSKPPRVDGTAKAKSILCYTSVSGGVLVTHATVILNTAIPSAVSGVIHTFGGLGLRETIETAEKTRKYLASLQ